MTKNDFLKIPYAKWDEEIEHDSFVIIPHEINYFDIWMYWIKYFLNKKMPKIFKSPNIYDIRGIHDSSFRLMSFALIKNDIPICLVGGCSDVINIEGIRGFGYKWYEKNGKCPEFIIPKGWSIDCLPVSGLLRIFCPQYTLISGQSLSSFEIFSHNKK